MGKVDLHIHSLYSDGCNTPEEIVMMAKRKNLQTIALTDHDTILGSKELMKLNKLGIHVYSGVELTVKVPKGRMHILGYNINLDDLRLNKCLEEIHNASIHNLLLYIELLKRDFGIVFPDEEIQKLVEAKNNVGRPQLALLMIKMGICSSVDEAFDKYLRSVYEKVRKVKKGLTKEEAIELITASGGVASLAHPGSLLLTREELFKEVSYLKSVGLGAIEVFHSNNPNLEREYYHELALYFNLLETGGTDFHGYKVKPDIELGSGRNVNVDIDENLSLLLKVKSRY